MNILGITIGGLVAFLFLLIGIWAFIWRKQSKMFLGKYAMIFAIALIVVGIIAGGFTYAKSLPSKLKTGGLEIVEEEPESITPISSLVCIWNANPVNATANVSFRTDPNDLSHLYADVGTVSGAATFSGNMSCDRSGDVEKAGSSVCYADAESFRNEVTTTDSNTYYIVDTSSKASKVSGHAWAQKIYLKDGSTAGTGDDQEKTQMVFSGGSSAQVNEKLGLYVALPGTTVWGYLNNQTSRDVAFYCGGEKVGRITITKLASLN